MTEDIRLHLTFSLRLSWLPSGRGSHQLSVRCRQQKGKMMKCFKVNGVQLTAREVSLLEMGDVEDTNELRDVATLRARMETAKMARKIRLQMQIDHLQEAAGCSGEPEASPIPV